MNAVSVHIEPGRPEKYEAIKIVCPVCKRDDYWDTVGYTRRHGIRCKYCSFIMEFSKRPHLHFSQEFNNE